MVRIAIDEEWYDLSKWAKYHPGGEKVLESFDGQDATAHFYSLHSDRACAMLKRMQPMETKEPAPEPHPIDKDFQALRAKLVAEFQPSAFRETSRLGLIAAMAAAGTYLAWSHPFVAVFLLALAMQQAGWHCHEMVHARVGPFGPAVLRAFILFSGPFLNGFNPQWWSEKHNTHHVRPNHIGIDPDIHNQPVLYLWAPSKSLDSHLRKYQHWYFLPIYSLLYITWRIQSFQLALERKDRTFVVCATAGLLWLLCLPWTVSLGSLLVGGFFVAIVVTVSHESEELFHSTNSSFVASQFHATVDVICPDPLSSYFFGGMQHQLAHHLLPVIPSYHLPKIRPFLEAFGKKHGLTYERQDLVTVYRRHFETLKRNAHVAAVEDEASDAVARFAYTKHRAQ